MALIDLHDRSASPAVTTHDNGKASPMNHMEADARFLRGILAALVFSALAMGTAAAYAAAAHFSF